MASFLLDMEVFDMVDTVIDRNASLVLSDMFVKGAAVDPDTLILQNLIGLTIRRASFRHVNGTTNCCWMMRKKYGVMR